jgi:hypothetical protein
LLGLTALTREAQAMVTKEHLKQEIELLDERYLELVFRLLQQFPHLRETQKPDAFACSRPIDYAVVENEDVPVFTEINDAALYGKQLRARVWQRN